MEKKWTSDSERGVAILPKLKCDDYSARGSKGWGEKLALFHPYLIVT